MCVLIAIYRVYNRFFKSNFILFGNFQKPKYIPSNTHTHTPKHIPTMVLRYELKETKRSANATLIRFSCDEFGFLHRNTKQKRKIDRENNCVISSGLPFLCGFTTCQIFFPFFLPCQMLQRTITAQKTYHLVDFPI